MKIEKIDKDGNVVGTFNSVKSASKDAKVSTATVLRQLSCWSNKPKKTHCGYTWRYKDATVEKNWLNEVYEKKKKAIYVVDEDGNKLQRYDSIVETSNGTSFSINMISHYLTNRCNRKNFLRKYGVGFEYANDEKPVETKNENQEIIKPEREEYFINILVGLVNRTLVDRATYNIKGVEYTYIKEKDMLSSNVGNITRDYYCVLCKTQLPLLKEQERKFLANLLKAFKDVVGIQKCNYIFNGFEFLRIVANNSSNNMDLPKFKAGEYYANLELNKVYSLKDLDI